MNNKVSDMYAKVYCVSFFAARAPAEAIRVAKRIELAFDTASIESEMRAFEAKQFLHVLIATNAFHRIRLAH